MNWDSLVPTLIKLGAPMLGQALGGPLGGAAGKILADALGASEPTPTAVNDTLSKSAPDATAAALKEAEDKWLAALSEVGKTQVSEIGATMRAEAASGDPLQRWWRPIYALEMTLFECPAFAIVLGHGLWTGKTEIINGLANLSGLIMTYMAARFGVLGVYVTGRSREKQASVTGQTVPSVIGEVMKRVVKGK
jgi:hypothetical protein